LRNGNRNAKQPRGNKKNRVQVKLVFEKVVEGFGSRHKRLPVSARSYNSDVETVHRTIEDEFYDIENFESIRDFHQRVASYQTWYNMIRVYNK
jgi:hypothetical protein